MKERDSQLCQSVSEFFQTFNWQGVQLAPLALKNNDDAPWQCLSVKEFFSLFNWQGKSLAIEGNHRPEGYFYLTSQVKIFFDSIAWDGNPEIGSLPQTIPLSATNHLVAGEMKLKNLSELF
jgi:hypothetical protein